MSSFARYRGVALAVAWRALTNFVKNPALLIAPLVFPLFFFVAFAGGLSRVGTVRGFDYPAGYTAFQFVFVFLQSCAFGGVFTGFTMAADWESGFARRLMLAAPHRSALLAGYALTAMVRSLGVVVLVFGVALVSGMQVGGNGIDLAGLVLLGLMVNLTTTLWAGGFALRTRTIQAAPAMQIPVFLILFMAPVYVPLNLLKGWIHTAASINPTTVLLETGRGFVAGQRTHTALAYAVAAALVLAFAAWALRGMRHAEAAG